MRRSTVLAALLVFAPAHGAADTYVIDNAHTFPTVEYNHLGFSNHTVRFDTTKGTITLDLEKKTGSADITIDVNSVNSGVKKFDDHLKSADFFEAEKYPTITFKSDRFGFEGDQLKEVRGELTLHGVTKPVTLKVTYFACKEHPMKKVQACGANAYVNVKRSDFGVGAFAPAVSDEATIRIQVEAHRQ